MESLIAPFDAYRGSEPYLFVSYAHRNSPAVFGHITRLRNEGFRIWYDEGIDPGTDWSDEIAAALNGAACFVVFISPEAVASHNVKKEIVFALSRQKPMIAVHLAETELPLGLEMQLGNIQAILENRFPDKAKFYARLMAALPAEARGEGGDVQYAPPPPAAAAGPAPIEDFEMGEHDVLVKYLGGAAHLIIPEGPRQVAAMAFAGNQTLKSVVLPRSVQWMDHSVFAGCEALEKVEMGFNTEGVGGACFEGCTGLREVKLSKRIFRLSGFLFSGCTALPAIQLPPSLTEMLAGGFMDCHSLEEITIPPTVEKMENDIFKNCPAVLHVKAGSCAEEYAKRNRLAHVSQ